jgi:hypothetical protein
MITNVPENPVASRASNPEDSRKQQVSLNFCKFSYQAAQLHISENENRGEGVYLSKTSVNVIVIGSKSYTIFVYNIALSS